MPFAYAAKRPQSARADVSPRSTAAAGLARSDLLRKEAERQSEVGNVRDLERWAIAGGGRAALSPPRWRVNGGLWLEYKRGGPYPRQPRGEPAPATREVEVPPTDLVPERAPTPELQPAPAESPSVPSEEGRERKLRLEAEEARDAATRRATALQDKLRRNQAAIETMLGSIAEMEAAIEADRGQTAKRERILQEEQERVRELTLRLHTAQSTLFMLQRKYGDPGHEQDTGSSLRSEVARLREQLKAEQTAAHESREAMSRERAARIAAEARAAELQRHVAAAPQR